MLTVSPVKASNLDVDSASGPYYTINSAVSAAGSGDKIRVHPGLTGTYQEHISVPWWLTDLKFVAMGQVTLDGNGCQLPYGFELIGTDKVQIKGFTIQRYAVAGIFIHADYSQPSYDLANDNEVVDNDVKDNCNTGIVIENGNANSIERNHVHNNTQLGIFINNGDKNVIRKNNDIYDNGETGIELHIASRTRVQKNDIHDNGGFGLRADGYAWGLSIMANSFSSNGLGGIYVISGGNTIDGNTINNNGFKWWNGNGILLQQGDDNVVTNNTIYSNAVDGIMVSYSWWNNDPSDRNTITNNTVYDNRHGIFLYTANWNTVWNNTVYHNAATGIQVIAGDHNTIYSNYVSGNGWGYDPPPWPDDAFGVDLSWDGYGPDNHWGTYSVNTNTPLLQIPPWWLYNTHANAALYQNPSWWIGSPYDAPWHNLTPTGYHTDLPT